MDLMAYDNLKDGFRTGDLLAFAGHGLLSRRIIARDGHYSHVAMLFTERPLKTIRRLMIHSVFPTGVVELPVSRALQDYRGRAWWVPMDHEAVKALHPHADGLLRDQALQFLGLPYDWRGVLSHLWPWLPDHYLYPYCSQLTIRVLRTLQPDLNDHATPSEAVGLPFYRTPVPL